MVSSVFTPEQARSKSIAPLSKVSVLAALLIIGSFASFWPTYIDRMARAPWIIHLHGTTAGLWLATLMIQPLTLHPGRLRLHRMIGWAWLGLFPFFAVGTFLVTYTESAQTIGNRFYEVFGPGLAAIDLITTPVLLWLFYNAVRERRHPVRHAGYMIATLPFSVMPIVTRFIAFYVPGMNLHGAKGFELYHLNMLITQLVVLAIALWLGSLRGLYRRPFIWVALIVVVQEAAFEGLGGWARWREVYTLIPSVPLGAYLLAWLAVGAVAITFAWRRPSPRAGASAIENSRAPLAGSPRAQGRT